MRKAVLIGLPFLALGMLFLLKLVFPFILAHLYSCKFNGSYRILVSRLWKYKIWQYIFSEEIYWSAIKCNYGTDIVIVTIILFYIEQLLKYFGINKKLLPRKTAFWVTVLVVVMFIIFWEILYLFWIFPNYVSNKYVNLKLQ